MIKKALFILAIFVAGAPARASELSETLNETAGMIEVSEETSSEPSDKQTTALSSKGTRKPGCRDSLGDIFRGGMK